MTESKRLVLIDGHAMLYRAWFAFPQSLTTREGLIINAVYGFTRILLNVINELHPEYLAVSFDVGKTFRHEMYAEYKAHREKMPEELKAQEPMVDRVLNALNIPVIAKEGFEADDVIGSLATQASERAKERKSDTLETVIVTGDKDILQLVKDSKGGLGQVRVYMPARANKPAVIYDEEAVISDLGVTAEQIPDYKGLAGDSSDNIPGVRGVGPKTAVALLQRFKSIDGVYQNLESGLKAGLKQKLSEAKKTAFLSKKLATIIREVKINLDLEACKIKSYNKQQAIQLFKELEFSTLVNKLPKDEFEEMIQEALF
jgi:DNA polymerase-1